MIPGEYFFADGEITINEGRESVSIEVKNCGDRPVQVGSHFHFFEVNRALKFDRKKALARRLDIPPGTAVRFEPGQTHTVQLILCAGKGTITGFNRLFEGNLSDKAAQERALKGLESFTDGT